MTLFLCPITEGNDLDDLIDDNVEGEEEEEEEAGEQKEKKKKKRKRSELIQEARCHHQSRDTTFSCVTLFTCSRII